VGVCEERLSALLVAVFQTGWQDFQDLQNGILIPLPIIFFYFVIFAFFAANKTLWLSTEKALSSQRLGNFFYHFKPLRLSACVSFAFQLISNQATVKAAACS